MGKKGLGVWAVTFIVICAEDPPWKGRCHDVAQSVMAYVMMMRRRRRSFLTQSTALCHASCARNRMCILCCTHTCDTTTSLQLPCSCRIGILLGSERAGSIFCLDHGVICDLEECHYPCMCEKLVWVSVRVCASIHRNHILYILRHPISSTVLYVWRRHPYMAEYHESSIPPPRPTSSSPA